MSNSELLDPFVAMLRDHVSSMNVRESERELQPSMLWHIFEESGFADALVSEERGGAGLSLADIQPLVMACGEYLLPPAFGHTLVARMLIATAGEVAPAGPILLGQRGPGGTTRWLLAPAACEAAMILTQRGGTYALMRLHATPDVTDGFGMVSAAIDESALLKFTLPEFDLFDAAAALAAATMVGAMGRVLEMTLSYANDRRQFGRPLAKFQAIQHQLSGAAEQVALAGVAARMPFGRDTLVLDPVRTAIAKFVANQAAETVCTIAHSVHGAIGISEEHDLQLYSRRLRRWQLDFGSSAFWARRIGTARLADQSISAVDFLRAI